MNVAVILGYGPEVAAVLARRHLLSPNLLPFTTNLFVSRDVPADVACLDMDDRTSARQELRSRNVTRVVMIGSFRSDNARLQGPILIRMAAQVGRASVSDGLKRTIYLELGPGFTFPAVKS